MKNYFALALLFCSTMFFGQDKPIGQIPFTLNEDGLMIISLQINNHTISNFVLDTGASVTVIDKKAATDLNLPFREEIYQSTGVNGVIEKGEKIQKQRISLNEKIMLKGLEIFVSDLAPLGKINGLIGFDLFREYVTETNFDTKTISFYKRKGKPNTIGYQSIPFTESFCTPEVDISVELTTNESFTGKVLFDTGNVASPLIFNSPFVTKNQLPSKFERLITSESRGINSTSKNSKGVISSLTIDNFILPEIPVALSNTKQGMSSKEAYMGNLGLEYISRFNFILDYNKKKIYLKPNKSYEDTFDFPLSGIGLEKKENEIFISYISEPSMAYDEGLRAGQRLISINGIEKRETSFYKTVLKKANQKVTIVVQLHDGSLKSVEILLTKLI